MKTIAKKVQILLAIALLIVQFPLNALAATQKQLHSNIIIDLTYLIGKSQIAALNRTLFNAVLNSEIHAYRNDSLVSVYTTNQINSGSSIKTIQIADKTDRHGKDKIDTAIVVPFDQQKISSNSISFNVVFDEKTNFQLEFSGFSLNFYCSSSDPTTNIQQMFVISKADLYKTLGEKQTTQLFSNCYRSMIKFINSDSTLSSDTISSFNVKLDNYMGDVIRFAVNGKMFVATILASSDTTKPIPAYKTNKLGTHYTQEELLDFNPYQNDPSNRENVVGENHFFGGLSTRCYSLCYTWQYDSEKMIATANLSAFGMYIFYFNESKKRDSRTYFWIDWKDVPKIYSSVEISILKYIFYKSFANFNGQRLKNGVTPWDI